MARSAASHSRILRASSAASFAAACETSVRPPSVSAGTISRAHPAGAYQLDQAIGADVSADPGVRHEPGRGSGRRIQEFIARHFVRREQRFELAAQLRVFGGDLVEGFAAQLRTERERLVQRGLDPLPALRFPDSTLSGNSKGVAHHPKTTAPLPRLDIRQ
jgi:hypothetical protein